MILLVLFITGHLCSAETAILETSTGTLYGTLELPKGNGPFCAVLIISGSGPTDRDGNSTLFKGANNSLKLLAESLSEKGIASLRYDKRGVGESAKAGLKEEELRFENYIDDAVLWIKQLEKDKRLSSLIILGHSEGSLIGIVASTKVKPRGFVSIAGSGRSASTLLLNQLKTQLSPQLLREAQGMIEKLQDGKRADNIPASLQIIFRPSVQPYLISWFRHDPIQEIKKLSIPILVIQGTTDIQVGIQDAKWLAEVNPSAKLKVIFGMNHILKAVPLDQTKQLQSYSDPALPIEPSLVDAIEHFTKDLPTNF